MAPDTAEMRPPRKGPTLRHARPDRREDCAATEVAATVTAQSISRDGARMAANLSPKHDARRGRVRHYATRGPTGGKIVRQRRSLRPSQRRASAGMVRAWRPIYPQNTTAAERLGGPGGSTTIRSEERR